MILTLVVWLMTHHSLSDVHELDVEGYRVLWQRDDDRPYPEGWCELRDPKGRTVVRLEDMMCAPLGLHETDPDAVIDVDGDGRKEVVLETWSGGAHASMTYQIWSLGKVPKCLLAWDKGNIYGDPDGYDFKFEDLNGDGKMEILTWYDGFCYSIFGAYSGLTPVVLALKDDRYVDQTQRFHSAADRIWRELANGASPRMPIEKTKTGEVEASVGEETGILDAWIYEWTQGTKDPKRAVLPLCSPQGATWLRKQDSAIRRCLERIPSRISYPRPYMKRPFRWDISAEGWDWNK